MNGPIYSIVPMGPQDKDWQKWNGHENDWCWVNITFANSFGITVIGPFRKNDAERYIYEAQHPTVLQRLRRWWLTRN